MLINSYDDFIKRVEELGFMPFSNIMEGLTSLSEETLEESWHTGYPDTDPWQWKDRAAEDKRLAFGCILGGNKGFIAPEMYSVFYRACHPEETMEELYEEGQIDQTVWQLWNIFEEKTLLNTSDIRLEMGVTQKKGGSRVDRAITELQRNFYITVAGNRRKTDKQGKPYGWPANVYDKCLNWVPDTWKAEGSVLSMEDARNSIVQAGLKMNRGIDHKKLYKILFK